MPLLSSAFETTWSFIAQLHIYVSKFILWYMTYGCMMYAREDQDTPTDSQTQRCSMMHFQHFIKLKKQTSFFMWSVHNDFLVLCAIVSHTNSLIKKNIKIYFCKRNFQIFGSYLKNGKTLLKKSFWHSSTRLSITNCNIFTS